MSAVATAAASTLKRKRSALTKLGVDALNLTNQRVLIRVDFNVPFKKVLSRHLFSNVELYDCVSRLFVK
jgi:hypothetical protein